MIFNIAIDGPAGAGKSTIAKELSRRLSFIYVDTGAMYRAMALYMVRESISMLEEGAIEKACEKVDISIIYKNGEQQVLLNGENVTKELRTEAVGNMASVTSQNTKVREKLVHLQQRLAEKENVVMDGRDIGTKVLPNANIKIYLTASSQKRALRRYEELKAKGENPDLLLIEEDIKERDHRDMTREISPLKQAEDAILVDSSSMTIDEVIQTIMNIYENRRNK